LSLRLSAPPPSSQNVVDINATPMTSFFLKTIREYKEDLDRLPFFTSKFDEGGLGFSFVLFSSVSLVLKK